METYFNNKAFAFFFLRTFLSTFNQSLLVAIWWQVTSLVFALHTSWPLETKVVKTASQTLRFFFKGYCFIAFLLDTLILFLWKEVFPDFNYGKAFLLQCWVYCCPMQSKCPFPVRRKSAGTTQHASMTHFVGGGRRDLAHRRARGCSDRTDKEGVWW